ncbi:FecR family protein [Chitinophaga alhagiae]|uniref:FecR family protein n=1 Tax=Chitinophaga alhagiae TaxID=2203219 RepID=UPI000E5BC893|nr:FecR domain-containing protein [Chitinophaga alhagiae]
MNEAEFIKLAGKISDGTASDEEIARYNAYFDTIAAGADEVAVPENTGREIKYRIDERLSGRRRRKRPLTSWLAAAVLLGGIVLAWTLFNGGGEKAPSSQIAVVVENKAPGGNRAVLTLANGHKIALDDAAAGNLATQAGARITKSAGDEVIYESAAPGTGKETGEMVFNVISTPRGGQFQVRLPDGTRVWLNAASSLRFPTYFEGPVRKVELTGEGYFEVAKDAAHPFIVGSSGQHIQVLGTHFNVNAYGDDGLVRTTLTEGSVQVNGQRESNTLVPGEQSQLNIRSGSMRKVKADVEQVMAWKNGNFLFNDTYLPDIMRQLSRWYDVEVAQDFPRIRYNGGIPRSMQLSDVLKMLEETGNVKFQLVNNTITIKH